MKRFLIRGARFLFVGVGIVTLTSFTIDATDTLRGSQSALSMLAGRALEDSCPKGTAPIVLAERHLCMDIYENSAGGGCVIRTPSVSLETKKNIETQGCQSVSVPGASPWAHVSYHQAKTLCAQRGMRLPTPMEWHEAMLGTPDNDSCNTSGVKTLTGDYDACRSARGVHDGVGNMWEWVDTQVTDGVYDSRTVPPSGYVTEVDASGIALTTSDHSNELYDSDYFWMSETGTFAVMRGGFYGGGTDAGLYATHMQVEPSFAGVATGFRCVMDL